MNNKKGFTLVELLAVIAILAVLVIIALPNIVRMFQQSRKNSFQVEANSIYSSAKKQYVSDNFSTPGKKIYGSKAEKKLNITSRSDIDYYVEMDGSGNVVKYCVKDGAYQFYYEGARLNDDEITEVKDIIELDDGNKIVIDEAGCDFLEKEIDVCYYYSVVLCPDDHAAPTEYTKKCLSKNTIEECFGNNLNLPYDSEVELYKTENTHPGNNLDSCLKSGKSIQECVSVSSYHTMYMKTSRVASSSQGCYASGPFRYSTCCLDGETEIEVYDKKKKKRVKKKLKDITYDDLIVCWDFVKGKTTYAKPFWIMKPTETNKSILLTFSDGTKLKVVGDHRIFSFEDNEFVSCEKCNIGITTINVNNEKVKLINKEFINEKVLAYNVITEEHINMYANGILTSQGSNNVYKMKDMKFVVEDRDMFTKEELSIVPEEYVKGLRLDLWKVYDKGSKEETLKDMEDYVNKLIDSGKRRG